MRRDCDHRKLRGHLFLPVTSAQQPDGVFLCVCSGASLPSHPSLIFLNPPLPRHIPHIHTHTHTHPCLPPAESPVARRSKQIDTPELGRINICRFTPSPHHHPGAHSAASVHTRTHKTHSRARTSRHLNHADTQKHTSHPYRRRKWPLAPEGSV